MKRKTVLKFPKKLFTQKEVKRVPKKSFKFPKRWKVGSTKRDWILTFESKHT